MPSSKAEHLHNPAPDYPRMSVKLGEQGQVMVRVFIGADGVPQKVELQTSSGFERLDKAGMDAAMRWRYVPGKRGGVAILDVLDALIRDLLEGGQTRAAHRPLPCAPAAASRARPPRPPARLHRARDGVRAALFALVSEIRGELPTGTPNLRVVAGG
jgi:TonB family protein